jgi:hypothetical protein
MCNNKKLHLMHFQPLWWIFTNPIINYKFFKHATSHYTYSQKQIVNITHLI